MLFSGSHAEPYGRIKDAVKHLPVPTPEFRLRVGWANTYEDLFAEKFLGTDDALSVAKKLGKGRILVVGRGGGAKTVLLARLAKRLILDDKIPVLVQLWKWKESDYQAWTNLQAAAARLDYLLSNFGLVPVQRLEIEELPPEKQKIILIDGLNEVNARIGQGIIYLLDDYVQFAPDTSVIVTDRMVRRSFDNAARWQLAALLPLTDAEIRRHIENAKPQVSAKYKLLSGSARELLGSPYFLNVFLQTPEGLGRTQSDDIEGYFRSPHVSLTSEELGRVSVAGFEMYKSSTRTFSISDFRARVGEEIVQKLTSAGALIVTKEQACFEHHLKHDFLVSYFLASNRELWNADTFGIVTFGASSFESITLTLEQLRTSADADDFLCKVYDWSVYGAGYALAEAHDTKVTSEMRIILLAMFAERRWDWIAATGEKAEDILNLMKTPGAAAFLATKTYQEIFTILDRVESQSDLFILWRQLFSRMPNSKATDIDIKHLSEDNPILGWTSSNVLKRLELNPAQKQTVRNLVNDARAVVRWRVVHVLGAIKDHASIAPLICALTDVSDWVSYGAIRSLVELANSSPQLAPEIFSLLQERIELLVARPKVVEEFQRAILVREDQRSEQWRERVLPLAVALQSRAETQERVEAWSRVLRALLPVH